MHVFLDRLLITTMCVNKMLCVAHNVKRTLSVLILIIHLFLRLYISILVYYADRTARNLAAYSIQAFKKEYSPGYSLSYSVSSLDTRRGHVYHVSTQGDARDQHFTCYTLCLTSLSALLMILGTRLLKKKDYSKRLVTQKRQASYHRSYYGASLAVHPIPPLSRTALLLIPPPAHS